MGKPKYKKICKSNKFKRWGKRNHCWGKRRRSKSERNLRYKKPHQNDYTDLYYDELCDLTDRLLQKDQSVLTHPFVNKEQNMANKWEISQTRKSKATFERKFSIKNCISNEEINCNSNEVSFQPVETNYRNESTTSESVEFNAVIPDEIISLTPTSSRKVTVNDESVKPFPTTNIHENESCTKSPNKQRQCSKRIVILKASDHQKINKSHYQDNFKPLSIKETTTTFPIQINGDNNSTCTKPNNTQNVQEIHNYDIDMSDEEEHTVRTNRRLQSERQMNEDQLKPCRPKIINLGSQNSSKCHKAADMWINVIKNPELFKRENEYDLEVKCKNDLNYNKLLKDYVLIEDNGIDFKKGKSPYETMMEKRLNDGEPNSKKWISQYYIPPAKMETFSQMFTEDVTAVEYLQKICLELGWPEPTYKLLKNCRPNEYFCSCNLKSMKFIPSKSASSEHLAKELVSSCCLNWFGLSQTKSNVQL